MIPMGLVGRSDHVEYKRRERFFVALLDASSRERQAARRYAETSPHLAPLRHVERQPRAGEPIEPIGPL